MTEIVSKPDYGDFLTREGKATDRFQIYLDDLTQRLNEFLLGVQVVLPRYTVATLPDVPSEDRGMIFVDDETGGAVPAFSDGTNWRRVTDRAIVS